MRKMWARIRNFCTRNLILFAAIALALVLGIGAIVLFAREISYIHPGPAIAVGMLVIVVLLAGLAINASQAKLSRKANELQAENRKLLHRIEQVQAENKELSRKIEQLQEEPMHSLPSVIGLDVLVEHWMKLSDRDSAIMYEQLLIAQQIFDKPDIREITFLKRFPGHKPERSAYSVQPQNRQAQVLKFDRIGNMRKERERLDNYVIGKISRHVPGRPIGYWPPESDWARLSDDKPGAVVYELAQLESAAPLTFGQYYAQKDVRSVENALKTICMIMAPWWDVPLPMQKGLYFEYKRLKDKLHEMEAGWQEVCENPSTSAAVQQYFSSSKLCNPLEWVSKVFDSPESFSARYGHLDKPGARRDSIVHGDFHGGNILIEDRDEPRIWLIDFPHTHIGLTVQDIARLEADIKFGHFSEELLANYFDKLLEFEDRILGDGTRQNLSLPTELPLQLHGVTASAPAEFDKAWCALAVLRRPVSSHYVLGDHADPYYLALLHATLPLLYYQDYSAQQKLYAFVAAAKLCERLNQHLNP